METVTLSELRRLRPAPGKYRYRLRFEPYGREQEYLPVHVVKGVEEGPALSILAAVHGDEYEGVQTAIRLFRDLTPEDIAGTVRIVPVVNVSAYENGTRTSGIDGGNAARAFPGDNRGTYTERVAWYVTEGLLRQSDFLLDLHSAGSDYAMPPMVGYHRRMEDGVPARSWQAAERFGMPVLWGHETVAPGRTVSAAADLGIPWLYVEGFGGRRVRPEEQALYEQGAYRLMDFLGMLRAPGRRIAGEAGEITHRVTGDGNLDQAVTAETDGFFLPEASLLSAVRKGDVIGRIVDWAGEELQVVEAHDEGIVMMLRAAPVVRKGESIYALGVAE